MKKKRKSQRVTITYADQRRLVLDLREEIKRMGAEWDLDKKRLAFLTSRHTALQEWANAARRLVFSFPGITEE